MAKTRQQKEVSVTQLTDKLQRMKTVVFTSFAGLSVKDVTDLRKKLRDSQIDYLVAKKTLLKRSLADAGFDVAIADQLGGGVALTFGYDDEVTPAKILQAFGKEHPALTLVGGMVGTTWYTGKQVEALAKLPSREQLLTQTVWTIKAPMTGLVNVMAGNIRSLINVLQALKDKQPAAA